MTPTRAVLLSGLLVLFAANAIAKTVMKFGGGAEVTIPSHYAKVEEGDASLVVVSRPEGNVRLFFHLHKLDAAMRVPRPGEAMVREQAEAKKKELKRRGNKFAFFDPGPPSEKDGRTFLNLHWQIGFGKTLVVMSAYIPRDARDQPDVKRFLSGDIESMIDSLRRVNGQDR
jgi:hypothetical protein